MKLIENTDLLQAVFNSASHGIAVMQSIYNEVNRVEDFSILLFNGYMLNWIGNIDYKGKRYSDVFPMTKQTGILKKFIEVAETSVTATFDRLYDLEGINHWFRVTAVKQAELLVVTIEDVTDLKRAEENLQQSEARSRHMIEQAPVATCLFVGREMKIEIANDIMIRYWGKGPSVMGKPLAEALPELKGQPFLQQLDEVFTTGKAFETEAAPAQLVVDGVLGTYYFNYTYKPLLNEQGEVYGIMDMAVDVTEQVLSRKKLEESDARFRNLFQEAPVAATLFRGPELVIEIANELTQKYWGKSKEIIGKPAAEAAPELEDQQLIALLSDMYQRGGALSFSEMPITFNENGLRKDGYYTHSLKALYDTNGNVESILAIGIEVTEQVKTRKRIEDSEARLKSVIDQTPAPTLVLRGDDLVIEQINKSMLHLIGRGEEVIGLPLITILPELEGQYVWEQVQKVYQEGVAFDQAEMLVQHNRTGVMKDYYYNVAYRPIKEEGRITGMIQVAIEVTEQVVARKKLEESESRFRALVNASSDVVYRMNADWTVMRNLEGRGFLSDTGEPILNWMDKYIHPQDRARVIKAVEEAIANKSTFELEHQVLNTDGALGWTFSRAIPILDDQGNIIEWFGTASDVTEKRKAENALKESEQDLRNLVLQSPIGICVMDAATLVNEIVNDKFVEIAGKPYEAIMGKYHWDTFAEAAPYYAVALQEVVDKGEAFYANEVELMLIRHGKEEIIYVTFVYEPMKDSSGSVKKIVVWVRENTLQVQARRKVEESENRYKVLSETLEQQVTERTKELQRSNADLQQFAHVASHDLKEPVRKIKTFTSRLEEHLGDSLDETGVRFMERIQVATDRMFTMIDGVLAYSTINAGTQKLASVDLNEVIKNIETDLELALQKTRGTIQHAELPTLEGAPVLLYQLFYNLINNSLKFAKAGIPPQIKIASEIVVEPQANFARITLEDNGIGFDPDQTGRIFETFTRLNAKDKYEGTGLGLSLCKKIVERHGGNIMAKGTPDQGATFIITLPLEQKETRI